MEGSKVKLIKNILILDKIYFSLPYFPSQYHYLSKVEIVWICMVIDLFVFFNI